MKLQFNGYLKSKLRLEIFGFVLYAGPWVTKKIDLSESVPATPTETIHLPDGFTVDCSVNQDNTASAVLKWENVPIAGKTIHLIPNGAGIPVSVQPIKGVILVGNITFVDESVSPPTPATVPFASAVIP
jgi:hypothetical protein